MKCDYCGKETRVDSYEVGGVVDCGKCRDSRTDLEKKDQRIAELEAENKKLDQKVLNWMGHCHTSDCEGSILEECNTKLQAENATLKRGRVSDKLLEHIVFYITYGFDGSLIPTKTALKNILAERKEEHTYD